jgi:hypothetical protein
MAKYVIPRHANIGAAAAENDDDYLSDCFVDTGLISRILSPNNTVSILTGRTGSGKSALFSEIRKNYEHVCELRPESLSLNFLADSWLLQVLTEADFDLGLFYQQLWRHVLVIELLKYEKGLDSETKTKGFISNFPNIFRDNSKKKRAFEYLTKYGGHFWEDTELRVRHIAESFAENVSKEMGIKFKELEAKRASGRNLSISETQELVVNARKIVSALQMQELANIIEILDEDVFDDKKKQVVLVIDDLDQQWADERVKVKLIEALINVLPKFRRIRNVRIVAAMRDDLLDVVLSQANTPGFQREKFEDQREKISWSQDQLMDLVNRRVNKLFKSKYTTEDVSIKDILPDQVGKQPLDQFVCDRTMMRPRDILAYFNMAFAKCGGSSSVSQKELRSIELEFSAERRRALVDEWRGFYPYIDTLIGFLGNRKLAAEFRLASIEPDIIADWVLTLHTKFDAQSDELIDSAKFYFSENTESAKLSFLYRMIAVLYRVGAVGVKTQANSRVQFSFMHRPHISGEELNENTPCLIHPMLWQNLSRHGNTTNLFN